MIKVDQYQLIRELYAVQLKVFRKGDCQAAWNFPQHGEEMPGRGFPV
ncbi:MAG: hypothetical protein RJR35_05440 [Thermoanaerobacterales bacterium]|nr:hypothetical protein [Thermoanaerobacterales bacterium]